MATYGTITLDGSLGDWSAADERPVSPTYAPPGARFFATVAGGSFVFALKTASLATDGARILIDSDRNDGSGSTFYGIYNESLVKFPPGGSAYPIARGVDFDIRFDAAGHPQLYRGDGTLLGPLAYALNGDTIEIAVPQRALGGAQPADVTLEFFNGLYGVGYVPPTFTVGGPATASGGVILDGSIGDWGPDERIDSWQTGLAGYEIYGRATPDAFAIALKAPQAIGAGSTVWINTDADMTTGQRIWGFAGGAEYRVDFDASGRPQLFAADGTLIAANLAYAYSPDHTTVELLVPKGLIGGGSEISTLYDINDSVFLPTRYLDGQYTIGDGVGLPVIASNGGGDAATLAVAENATAVTTVAATDPDGGAPRYAILAGVDALAFALDPATGALRFASAPDFEAPADENRDNVYEVTVAAVDAAGHSDTQILRVAVTDVAGRTLTGTSAANTLTGGAEDDVLSGLGGKDKLSGMGGADVLKGGAGVDTLTGGAGPDRFGFASTGEIGNGTTATTRDVITDFQPGSDRIDLSAIDANGGARGNGSFAFAGSGPLTAVGQIHVVHATIGGVEHTVVEGNVSGGPAPEFRLDLLGNLELAAGDFLL
jgi:Ca2+-binding RTX toxin-like protein